jgi:hypothetical protein
MGSKLKHLDVGTGMGGDSPSEEKQNYFHGHMIDTLNTTTEYCQSLEILRVADMNVNVDISSPTKNNTIKHVEIGYSTIGKGGLIKLMEYLPSMQHLTFDHCHYEDFTKQFMPIDIPSTHFRNLTWRMSNLRGRPTMPIKLNADTNQAYYYIKTGIMEKLSQENDWDDKR